MVRSPVRKSWSVGSTSLVMRLAASASVLAIMTVGTPMTSAASLADTRFLTACDVGMRTLPPMCPHFFSEASWSSKWTPAAPASIMAHQFEDVERATETGLGISDYRGEPMDPVPALGVVDLVGPLQRLD